jgi:CheY-like chemotaxis protein
MVSAASIAASARGRGETVLVVEDEAAIRSVTEMMLAQHNYCVLAAADGPEALALFALHMAKIDVVLTDIAMPHMDGVMLARALKKMKPDICIIASTGRSDDPRIRDLRSIGVDTCLNKPYSIDQLLTTIEHLLRPEPKAA